eukprot:6491092-Amphidinium_carterae.6
MASRASHAESKENTSLHTAMRPLGLAGKDSERSLPHYDTNYEFLSTNVYTSVRPTFTRFEQKDALIELGHHVGEHYRAKPTRQPKQTTSVDIVSSVLGAQIWAQLPGLIR